ncbi:MAG: PDZ domain-containing protein [Chloroflexi bacterium]|nr:PDZ domain-containing protein [Chloroflexota bacterium]
MSLWGILGLTSGLLLAGCGGVVQGSQMSTSVSSSVAVDALEPAPVLGVVVDRQMRIVDIEAGSTAQRAGIRRGDTLIAIGTVPVASPSAARQAFRRVARPGQTLRVTVNRGGRALVFQVVAAPPVGHSGAPTPTPVPPTQEYF